MNNFYLIVRDMEIFISKPKELFLVSVRRVPVPFVYSEYLGARREFSFEVSIFSIISEK